MISTEEASKIILDSTQRLAPEERDLDIALDYVLAEDLVSQVNVPLFNNSAMDGFAIHKEDLQSKDALEIIGEVKAGQSTKQVLQRGRVISVMTGAPIPNGTAAVIPIENVQLNEKVIKIITPVDGQVNIRLMGEDIRKGTVLIKKGTRLKPVHLGLAASTGISRMLVYKKPKIALIITGDEVKSPGHKLKPGEIFDSNSFLLKGLIKKTGQDISYIAKAADNLDNTKAIIGKSFEQADVILTTGGISVGKHDYVSAALNEIGATCLFSGVRQKPGKPLSFYTYDEKLILSLPGNPVAVAVCYELYVRPLLLKMSGNKQIFRKETEAVLAKMLRKKKGRKNWIRVILREENGCYIAESTGAQGSGILTSLLADGIAAIEEEQDVLRVGQKVKVINFNGDYN